MNQEDEIRATEAFWKSLKKRGCVFTNKEYDIVDCHRNDIEIALSFLFKELEDGT